MFSKSFEAITGHPPFPWQESLFERFLRRDFPRRCDIPTGLGKTSVIAIWLLALAEKLRTGTDLNGYPRRLIYVVNRRTVVDQATREVERLRLALSENQELKPIRMTLGSLDIDPLSGADQPSITMPLAISTLRGEFADNAEWRANPARPAVIIGTVDMIGSRLLFAGYGCGFRSSPLHAGFLGQDSLLIHDEAHLEPAFQKLLDRIVDEQERCGEFRLMRIMELTATSRSDGISESSLIDADLNDEIVRERLYARKGLEFVYASDAKAITDEIAKCALEYRDSGQAILIFLRTIEDVYKVRDRLIKEFRDRVLVLTGTMRGLERERELTPKIFERFFPNSKSQETVYLISTSAGEVGIDISADHLICDLTPFDATAQRFGRVNRFGKGDAHIHVICEEFIRAADDANLYEQRRQNTRALLLKLPIRDDGLRNASPDALRALPANERLNAFTPPPQILPATDILFDSWAMTTIRDDLPGRPAVEPFLHGIASWDPPETRVAWRSEVDEINTPELREENLPDDLLEDYPVKPHELLHDRAYRVFKQLQDLAARHGEKNIWIISGRGKVTPKTLDKVIKDGEEAIHNLTVLLPPSVGGLSGGMLDGKAKADPSGKYDVADEWFDTGGSRRRERVWDDAPRPEGMRLIRNIDLGIEDEDEVSDKETALPRTWYWFEQPRSADNEGSRAAIKRQELDPHLKTAGDFATEIITKLALREPEASAVILAAKCHDLGKRREKWQRSIRNSKYPEIVLAKSAGRMFPKELSNYRHEFGSLIDLPNDISRQKQLESLDEDARDLVMHLIAAHHGRARPHFPADEAFDPERDQTIAAQIARQVPRRFARMQRKYGRWGLAYLESLVRAADILASQAKDKDADAL